MQLFQQGSSLNKRLNMLITVCCLPFAVLIIYLLVTMNQFSQRYDVIVENITKANAYNIDFKEDLDYTMYIIVANSERAQSLVNVEEPKELISEAREVFEELYQEADSEEIEVQLERILNSLDTLENRVNEIIADAQVSGNYDKNIERLDLNIRILTELIQEQIQRYIYQEATHLEVVRESIRMDVNHGIQMSLLLFVLILLGAVFISRKIANSIKKPIQNLCHMTKLAGKGDFDVRAEDINDNDEIEELNDSFNGMVEKIGDLVEDIRIEQLNLRVAELKLLQSQINPHFLYNTLDTILWLAEMKRTEEVVHMVMTLSNFFRSTLSKGRDYITIKEEEAHVRSYLEIQQFRYQDILEYHIEIDPELYEYEILKLTLQPLVENALYHGIKNKREGGKITVTGRREGENIRLDVTDNGVGMSPERLEYIRKVIIGEEEEDSSGSGFGLFNVAQRITLNYGRPYGLSIESEYSEGTCVTVLIPAKEISPDLLKEESELA